MLPVQMDDGSHEVFKGFRIQYNFYWTLEEVYNRLNITMTRAFYEVHQMAQARQVHNRLVAYLVAL